jgi:hypothetical protein
MRDAMRAALDVLDRRYGECDIRIRRNPNGWTIVFDGYPTLPAGQGRTVISVTRDGKAEVQRKKD